MNTYRITIGRRSAPRLEFQAMSPDSCTCAAQHADLCEVGERLEVVSLAQPTDEQRERMRERKALERQVSHQDVQDRINRSASHER
jgi:hypothetical protein